MNFRELGLHDVLGLGPAMRLVSQLWVGGVLGLHRDDSLRDTRCVYGISLLLFGLRSLLSLLSLMYISQGMQTAFTLISLTVDLVCRDFVLRWSGASCLRKFIVSVAMFLSDINQFLHHYLPCSRASQPPTGVSCVVVAWACIVLPYSQPLSCTRGYDILSCKRESRPTSKLGTQNLRKTKRSRCKASRTRGVFPKNYMERNGPSIECISMLRLEQESKHGGFVGLGMVLRRSRL